MTAAAMPAGSPAASTPSAPGQRARARAAPIAVAALAALHAAVDHLTAPPAEQQLSTPPPTPPPAATAVLANAAAATSAGGLARMDRPLTRNPVTGSRHASLEGDDVGVAQQRSHGSLSRESSSRTDVDAATIAAMLGAAGVGLTCLAADIGEERRLQQERRAQRKAERNGE